MVSNGDLTAKQFSTEVALLRKITPWLEAGLGANLINLKSGFDVDMINSQNGQPLHLQRDMSKTWLDPMVIARTTNMSGKRFLYNVKGEIGGFGVGSKLAWQLRGLAGKQFSQFFYALAGYRIISVDYKKGKNMAGFFMI